MKWFKASPLHRRRRGKRRDSRVRVLDEAELCLFFDTSEDSLTQELERLAWPYHRDANNRIWATVDMAQLAAFHESSDPE